MKAAKIAVWRPHYVFLPRTFHLSRIGDQHAGRVQGLPNRITQFRLSKLA